MPSMRLRLNFVGVHISSNLSKLPLTTPLTCQNKRRTHQQDRVDAADLEPAPPLQPLTAENLLVHTQITNPGQKPLSAMSGSTVSSVPKSDKDRLAAYGLVKLRKDQKYADYSPDIDTFVKNVVQMYRPEQTPSAKQLQALQERAAKASEAQAAQMISEWLMFRDCSSPLGGDKYVYLSHEVRLGTEYVKHEDPDYSLSEPRLDKVNGYVAPSLEDAQLTSPFTPAQEVIIKHHMGPILSEYAFFAWLTAQFKSSVGKTLQHAEWQCDRDGVAICNYNHSFFDHADITADEVDTVHFSLACDARVAALFIYWLGRDGVHYVKQVCEAPLHSGFDDEDHNRAMAKMRMYLRNIRDWALGARLDRIKSAVNIVEQRVAGEKGKKEQANSKSKVKSNIATSSASSRSGNRGKGQSVQPSAGESKSTYLPQRFSKRLLGQQAP
jgi:hypothetical protein